MNLLSKRPAYIACLFPLLLCSCARTEVDGHRFEVSAEDGVTVALTTGGPRYEVPLFTTEELLTLQEDPSEPESMLFNPSSFTMGPDGNFFVADNGNGRIAVFNPNGRYLRSFGRKGDGPGEFRLMDLQSLHDGVLSIFDYTNQRTTQFRADGTLLDVFSSPVRGYALSLARTPEGTILQEGVRMERKNSVSSTERRVAVLASGGRDTLAIIRTGLVENMYTRVETTPGGGTVSFGMSLPFTGSPEISYVPGRGILSTDGDSPELTWYDTSGQKDRIIRIDLPSVPVTAEKRSEYLDQLRAQMDSYSNRAGRNPIRPEDLVFPETVGFCRRVTVDDAGYIWCLDVLALETHEEGEGWLFHVIDPEGCYLGKAELPTGRPSIAGGRLMCFIEDPESGASIPTVFSLLPAVEGFRYPR